MGLSLDFLSAPLHHISAFAQIIITISMTVVSQSNLKSGNLDSPIPFFKISFTIWGFYYFHTNCKAYCSSSMKKMCLVIWDCFESVNCFGLYSHFLNIDSSSPVYISPFVCVIFYFFHQYSIFFLSTAIFPP